VMGVREVPVKQAAVRDLAILLTMRTKRQKEKVSKINHVRGILAEYGLVTGKCWFVNNRIAETTKR